MTEIALGITEGCKKCLIYMSHSSFDDDDEDKDYYPQRTPNLDSVWWYSFPSYFHADYYASVFCVLKVF